MAEQSSSISSSELPSWAKDYVTKMLERAATTAAKSYQPYGGQRFAGYNPLASAAYAGLGSLGPSSYLGSAAGMATDVGTAAGNVGKDYATMATDPTQIQKYMSPYMQNVVEQQKRSAVQDYSRQIPGMQTAAIRSGARGGTREALAQSEAQRNLNQQLQGIQAAGSQQAFQNAQQAQQFGAGLGLQGLQSQLGAAQVLGGLGGQEFSQKLQALEAQRQGGAEMRNLEQQRLDAMYQDYLAQQQYPYNQALFMGNVLRGGTPTSASTSTTSNTPSPSAWSQLMGAGTGVYSIGKMFGWWDK